MMERNTINELKKLVKNLEKLEKMVEPGIRITAGDLQSIANNEAFKIVAMTMEKHNYDAIAAFDDIYGTCKEVTKDSEKDIDKHIDSQFKKAKYKKGEQDYLKNNAKWGTLLGPTVIYPLQILEQFLHHTKVNDAKGLVVHALEEITNYVKEKEL